MAKGAGEEITHAVIGVLVELPKGGRKSVPAEWFESFPREGLVYFQDYLRGQPKDHEAWQEIGAGIGWALQRYVAEIGYPTRKSEETIDG